MNNDKD